MPRKPIEFLGDSRARLKRFPEAARREAGYQLESVQEGDQPRDFKPMPTIGKGVEEMRIGDQPGTYRVIYFARLADAVYVLHAFQKKSQSTSRPDLDIARQRFLTLSGARR